MTSLISHTTVLITKKIEEGVQDMISLEIQKMELIKEENKAVRAG